MLKDVEQHTQYRNEYVSYLVEYHTPYVILMLIFTVVGLAIDEFCIQILVWVVMGYLTVYYFEENANNMQHQDNLRALRLNYPEKSKLVDNTDLLKR